MTRYLKPDNPDACISCNICLTACPVARATRLYRGPKLTGPALSRLRMLVSDEDPMLQYCSNCKNCDRVCPSGTPISTLNMKARGAYYQHHPHTHAERILARNEQLGRAMTSLPLLPAAANFGMGLARRLHLLEYAGISSGAPLPRYAARRFLHLFRALRQPHSTRRVLFFPGCYVNYNEPQLGIALIRVLNHHGVEVVVDERFRCCGSPLLSAGYLAQVEHNARHNVALLASYARQQLPILTTCTTCSLILKQEYDELFRLPETAGYRPLMYDAMEYLLQLHQEGQLDTALAPIRRKLIYHTPCHLRVQGFGRPTLSLLRLIPQLEVEDADAGCCGLSGIYGYKTNTAAIARDIGAPLRERIISSSASEGVCECNICRLQMQNGTGKPAWHPLRVMCQSYGL